MMPFSLLPPHLQPSAFEEKAIEKVDDLLESYMGIRDTELGKWLALESVGVGGFQILWTESALSTSAICTSTLLLPPHSSHHGRAWEGQEEPR